MVTEEVTTPACKPKYRRLTSADHAYILKLRDQKLTQAEIAQRIGCTQQAVSDWLRQCQDSTAEATLYLKGRALSMAKNIVSKGLARDHIQALKGIKVLEDDNSQKGIHLTINGIALVGMPVSPRGETAESERLQITEEN